MREVFAWQVPCAAALKCSELQIVGEVERDRERDRMGAYVPNQTNKQTQKA